MKLGGIDAGFTAGFAIVEPRRPPITGSRSIPGSATELGRALHYFGHFVGDLIDEYHLDGLVLCQPFIAAFAYKTKSGLNRVTPNVNVSMVLDGMFGIACAVAYARKIPLYPLYENGVRASFGISVPRMKNPEIRRKALKAAVVACCSQHGWQVTNDHAGDALLATVYQLGKIMPERAHEMTPLFATAPKRRRKRAA